MAEPCNELKEVNRQTPWKLETLWINEDDQEHQVTIIEWRHDEVLDTLYPTTRVVGRFPQSHWEFAQFLVDMGNKHWEKWNE